MSGVEAGSGSWRRSAGADGEDRGGSESNRGADSGWWRAGGCADDEVSGGTGS